MENPRGAIALLHQASSVFEDIRMVSLLSVSQKKTVLHDWLISKIYWYVSQNDNVIDFV